MDVVFGLWADGRSWPEHGGGPRGALGSPVVGPMGLLGLLQDFYGLGGPAVTPVARIAAWQAKLTAAEVPGARFWSASRAQDPWSTARLTLAWRDVLVGGGWRADAAGDEPRLADLAAAEMAGPAIPAGLTDRACAVIAAIRTEGAPPWRMRLMEPPAQLPPVWERLLAVLDAGGMDLAPLALATPGDGGSDLAVTQAGLDDRVTPAAYRGDGSLVLLNARTELAAADAVAEWLRAGEAEGVVIVAQSDTTLLDARLRAHGLGRLGVSAPSPNRGALQVLRLAFAIAWSPFDPQRLLELLMLPRPPVARRAAWRLANALGERPGVGSRPWLAAWTAIEAAELELAAGDAAAEAAIPARLARWREWVTPQRHDPRAGMTAADARGLCDRVTAWALGSAGENADPLLLAAANAATALREAIGMLGVEQLPRLLLDRMIDDAIGAGAADPTVWAEVAGYRAVSHPGAMWGPASTVIWWDFVDGGERPALGPWRRREREALAVQGVALDPPGRAARRLATAWERPIRAAARTVILVGPSVSGGEERNAHPLAHRLPASRSPAMKAAISAQAEDLLAAPETMLAGRVIARRAAGVQKLPDAHASWARPGGFEDRLAAASAQTATSLESLLSCPMQWALRHVGRIRPGRLRRIPDTPRLLGELAHALAEEIFTPGAPPAAAEAEARATARLDALIDEMAAPLRLDGAAADLFRARRAVPAAMGDLADILTRNGLEIVGVEQAGETVLPGGLALSGRMDLVARTPAGQPVVVDLKWSSSDRYRRRELGDGLAVQLAVYSRLAAVGGRDAHAGYYLLAQRRFLVLEDGGLDGMAVRGARSLPETLTAVEAGWAGWRAAHGDGRLLALGVEDPAVVAPADVLRLETKCGWCDYRVVCRVRGSL